MAEFKNVSGFKELKAALETLPKKLQRNGLRRAVSKGAAVIRNEAKNTAPLGETGTLRRAIAMKRAKTPDGKIATYEVFVRQAKNGKRGQKDVKAYGKFDAYYWRFVEFGTSKMAAQPFMRPAFEAKKDEAVEVIRETLIEGIEAATR